MVLSSYAAGIFTTNATAIHDTEKLQRDVDLTERAILNAATYQRNYVVFNAMSVGNPPNDPTVDTHLTSLQIAYRDAFVNSGYLVTRDAATGYWKLTWASQSIETNVSVYSIRTTVTPGAIFAETIQLIDCFFAGQATAAYASSTSVISGSGGDIQETDFGATLSTFYEYISVVQQQNKSTDFSSDLLNELTTSTIGVGLGYTTANTAVYKLV